MRRGLTEADRFAVTVAALHALGEPDLAEAFIETFALASSKRARSRRPTAMRAWAGGGFGSSARYRLPLADLCDEVKP